jgi:5'-nucleotidase
VRILLTNDDGILAPGLVALHAAVADLGEVSVVAPASPQSAAGHGITVGGELAVERVSIDGKFWGLSVEGRPADCVKLAFRALLPKMPELVLSGINAGANTGINVLYSGTVAAAAEGAMLGAKAVAFSLSTGGDLDFTRAARYCRAVLEILLEGNLESGHLVNVNVPRLKEGGPAGICIARQSVAAVDEKYTGRRDAEGRDHYQLTDWYGFLNPTAESDVAAVERGYITLTPLHVDLTDSSRLESLSQLPWKRAMEKIEAPRRRRGKR